MGLKARALFADGREDFIDTSDLLDKTAYPDTSPTGILFTLDAERAEERGIWLKSIVVDADRCRYVAGHEPARTPALTPAYDIRLWSAEEASRLVELAIDSETKLKRVHGSLVNLSALRAAVAEHLSQDQEQTSTIAQAACEVLLAIELAEADGAHPAGREDIARRIGWDWTVLEPMLAEYEADLTAWDDGDDEELPISTAKMSFGRTCDDEEMF